MPQKLQVDESFAFLFMCIEASGCKLDYRLIGEATDLNPAAARMRYTRLKRAVETGLFKGATLSSKPTTTSPQLAALANPESRRLGNAAATSRTQRPRRATRTRQNAQAKVSASKNEDEAEEDEAEADEEEEEEEAEEADTPSSSIGDRLRRKRLASNIVSQDDDDDDSEMFYADTSRATRRTKQIKRSDSDIEAEEQEEAEEVEEPEQQDKFASRRTTAHHRRARGGTTTRSSRSVSQDFDGAAFAGPSSRRKASAANAAESAYAVGIASGRYAFSPEDTSSAQMGRDARLRNISTSVNAFANSGRKTPGTSSAGMRQLNARDRQFLARHGQASQPTFSPSLVHINQFNNLVPATASRSPPFGQHNSVAGRMPPPSPYPSEDPSVHAEPNNPRPHHTYDAASVFDNFSPPMDVATRFAPSSTQPSPAKWSTPRSHKSTQQNNAVANIDPQLMAAPAPPPQRITQSRQTLRATTTIPESAQNIAEGPTQTKLRSPHVEADTTSTTRILRPRSAVPPATATASELELDLEIAEMLRGLKQGSAARSESATVPASSQAVVSADSITNHNQSDRADRQTPSAKQDFTPNSNPNSNPNPNSKQSDAQASISGSRYPDLP